MTAQILDTHNGYEACRRGMSDALMKAMHVPTL